MKTRAGGNGAIQERRNQRKWCRVGDKRAAKIKIRPQGGGKCPLTCCQACNYATTHKLVFTLIPVTAAERAHDTLRGANTSSAGATADGKDNGGEAVQPAGTTEEVVTRGAVVAGGGEAALTLQRE